MPILVYKHTILQGGNNMIMSEPISEKSTGADGHATTFM